MRRAPTFTFVATMDEVLKLALLTTDAADAPAAEEPQDAPLDVVAMVPVARETGPVLSADSP